MKSDFTYSLADETYPSEEARKLAARLISETIRFHNMKSLRSWEADGVKDEHSEKRIEQLKEMRERVIQRIKDLEGDKVSVEINTEIKITAKQPAEQII